jgi:hypothetical protein
LAIQIVNKPKDLLKNSTISFLFLMIQLPSIYTFLPIDYFQNGQDLVNSKKFLSQQNHPESHLNLKENISQYNATELKECLSVENQAFQFTLPSSSTNKEHHNFNSELRDKHNSYVDQLQKNQLIQLLKWISGSFPLTIQYFFQSHHSFFKNIIPISKREIGRLTQQKLIQFIYSFQDAIKSIIETDDIRKLLEHTFKLYRKPNMKTIKKINLDTFYSVGYRSFFPSYEPFEIMLKEMKDY